MTPKQRLHITEAAKKQRSLVSRLSPIRGSSSGGMSKLNQSELNTSMNIEVNNKLRISSRKCNSLNISQEGLNVLKSMTPNPLSGTQANELKTQKDNGSSYKRIKRI